MKRAYLFPALIIVVAAVVLYGAATAGRKNAMKLPQTVLAAKFEFLSRNGNSSCSGAFTESIASLPDGERLRGSCCSPMDLHRYGEQVEGLKAYRHISEIPSDPYDIDGVLAKRLQSYYELELTLEEQKAWDYAMEHSHEKGPCCCKCWRWYVYGGLGKHLIRQYSFTGEEVAKVWNLSDGCGGAGDHAHG
jgi:hypothetical protein